MTGPTASETLFEAFCQRESVKFRRVERTGVRTPDYDLLLGPTHVVAEVKQLDPNLDDEVKERQLERTGMAEAGAEPGKRVRQVITNAKEQIKNRTRGQFPGLLIVYNNVPVNPIHTDPFFVLVGMYGHLQVSYVVPHDPAQQPFVTSARFGPKRRMTEEHNTSISAVCILHRDVVDNLTLTFYHNCFAANEFDPAWLRRDNVHHYRIRGSGDYSFRDWEPV